MAVASDVGLLVGVAGSSGVQLGFSAAIDFGEFGRREVVPADQPLLDARLFALNSPCCHLMLLHLMLLRCSFV